MEKAIEKANDEKKLIIENYDKKAEGSYSGL
jgi:hypothetical protein